MPRWCFSSPWVLLVTLGCVSCAVSGTRPEENEPPTPQRLDHGFEVPEVPDDGLGEIPGWRMEWVVQAGGADRRDLLGDLAWDSVVTEDDIYLTGRTYSEGVVFGPGTADPIKYQPYQDGCLFLARYRSNGSVEWVRIIDTALFEPAAICLTDHGPLISGRLQHGSVVFGAGEPHETTYNLACDGCPFAAQYTLEGALAWSWLPASSKDARGYVCDNAKRKQGGTYLVGSWRPSFGEFELASGVKLEAGTKTKRSSFLVSLNEAGGLLWVRRFDGPGTTSINAVATMPDDGCAVSLVYEPQSILQSGTDATLTLDGEGNYRQAIARYDRDGELLWVRDLGLVGSYMHQLEIEEYLDFKVSLENTGNHLAWGGLFSGQIEINDKTYTTLGEASAGLMIIMDHDGVVRWGATLMQVGHESAQEDDIPPLGFKKLQQLDNDSWIATGQYWGQVRLAAGQPDEVELEAKKHHLSSLLTGWSPDGELSWWREISGKNEGANLINSYVQLMSISKAEKAIYLTGGFMGTIRFGARPGDARTLTSWGSYDIFLMKLVPYEEPI